jgi:hypothetical protein
MDIGAREVGGEGLQKSLKARRVDNQMAHDYISNDPGVIPKFFECTSFQ